MSSQMFTGASIGTISGGTFAIYTHSEKSALDKLSVAAAHSALHDAPARTDETRCHRQTRTNVLDKLERWAQGLCDEGASIFWLQGGAGAGKSAIMQSLAERCAAQGLALGSFFFFRSDPTRNSVEVIIPTLVYQLAQLSSSLLDVLGPIMDRDPLIFKKSFQVQLFSVLIPALRYLVQIGIISDTPQSPRVFLIDGLDECSDPVQQQAIIRAVAAVCHGYHIPVKFLIASRPELAISTSFGWFKQENHTLGSISLSEDPDADVDIRRFIEDEFLKIRLQHPFRKMIPSDWPLSDDIDSLVRKSSSHFIYASTAVKYIWSAKEIPVRSLQVVLGLEVSRTGLSPFPELDALFYHILGSAAHRDKVVQILTHCAYTRLPPSTTIVCFMLACSKDDLFVYMADMGPLMVVGRSYFANLEEVKLLHASLGDFLQDQSRSGSLYVNKEVYLASRLERSLQLFEFCSRPQLISPHFPVHLAADRADGFQSMLTAEIITTIEVSGHLLVTEEILERYSLRDFHQCQQRFKQVYGYQRYDSFEDICRFLIVVHWMQTPNAARLFQRFVEDFFDILESYVALESTSFAAFIVTLAYSGYPAHIVHRILHEFQVLFRPRSFCRLMKFTLYSDLSGRSDTVLYITAKAAPASVRYSTNTCLKRLTTVAEAILECLVDQRNLHFLSTYSTHRLWLQQTKPGKHISTGAPKLASVCHSHFLSILHRWEDPYRINRIRHGARIRPTSETVLKRLLAVLGPKYGNINALYLRQNRVTVIVHFLQALLWLLPKVDFSEKIMSYSKRMFPWDIYQREAGLCRRVHKCLDTYTNRVQNAKQKELGHRISNGDANALIEKLRMLNLNAQD